MGMHMLLIVVRTVVLLPYRKGLRVDLEGFEQACFRSDLCTLELALER
jgi:hypothetical protein